MQAAIIRSQARGVSVTSAVEFCEALILVSTNPEYDKRLFIELRVQYMKIPSSKHVVYINCSECQNKNKNNLCTQYVLSLEFSCTELVIQRTICCHIVG